MYMARVINSAETGLVARSTIAESGQHHVELSLTIILE